MSEPSDPAPSGPPDRVKPAAAAAGVASLALAGGIIAVNLTSRSRPDLAGVAAADDSTSASATSSASSGNTTGASSTAASGTAPGATAATSATGDGLTGSWTGTVAGGGDPVKARVVLADDLSGQLLFADPDTDEWVPAGAITGRQAGGSLHLQTDTQVTLTLKLDGAALSGTGTLVSTDKPFPITVSLNRA